MKKLLSLVLALVMVLSLTVPVLATESDGTWSYDPNTKTFTVNCTIPKNVTLGMAIPKEVSITSTGEITGISGLVALWGKTSVENGYLYDSRNWMPAINKKDDPNAVFKANTEYGYVIVVAHNPSELQNDLAVAKIVLNGKEYSNVGYAKMSDTYAEMFIVVDFGVLGADGNFTGGDFAEASTNKSGSTSITFTKEKPKLAYTIVIPTATTLTEESHKDVQLGGTEGKASVEITTGDDKTNIYYTVDFKDATLTNGTNNITTTYAYAQGGDYSALTNETKVTVYEGGTVQNSTVQVTADETSWTAAPAGTYTASVVFNFGTEEVTPVTAADALVENAYFKLNFTTTQPYNGTLAWSMTYNKTASGFEATELLENNENVLAYAANDIQVNANGSIITINMGWEYPLTFTLDTSTNIYSFTGDNNQVTFTSFSVKPAGATEFTEVTLTPAR